MKLLKKAAAAAIAVALAVGCAAVAAEGAPSYLRFVLADGPAVYAQIQDGQLRVAATGEAMKDAAPVAGRVSGNYTIFPAVTLPFPKETLAGEATATLRVPTVGAARADVVFTERNEQGVWTVQVSVQGVPGRDVKSARAMSLPSPGKLTIQVVAKTPKGLSIPVGVQLPMGMVSAKKDGKEIPIELKTYDAQGKEVASSSGTPADFGFA